MTVAGKALSGKMWDNAVAGIRVTGEGVRDDSLVLATAVGEVVCEGLPDGAMVH